MGKGVQPGTLLGIIAVVFLLGYHVNAQRAQVNIRLYQGILTAGQFADTATAGLAEKFHLPPAVLRLDETLCKKQINHIIGVDVGRAGGIADHLHALLQSRRLQLAFYLRQGAAVNEDIVGEAAAANDNDQRKQDD